MYSVGSRASFADGHVLDMVSSVVLSQNRDESAAFGVDRLYAARLSSRWCLLPMGAAWGLLSHSYASLSKRILKWLTPLLFCRVSVMFMKMN